MYRDGIIEARKMEDTFVALNDHITIKLNRIPDFKSMQPYLTDSNKLEGRVVAFEDSHILLDVSRPYCSKQFTINYGDIYSIQK